ncbi:hypothetical protein [Planctomycetes bacterium K23_9]|uniref:histidine kinase n=1 Tax=Stieleria marina TaxID=1930275 RepID=A0A517NWW3_9BACT|nr:hypothetical protein K239x_36140 [Planctomycetes bacterium K23_9]
MDHIDMSQTDAAGGVCLSREDLHDLRNEVHAIRLGVMLLEKERLPGRIRNETIADIKQSIERLVKLADKSS